MCELCITEFDKLLSMSNEWSDYCYKDFYVCYAEEFGEYCYQIEGNVKNAKAIMKDVFWITKDGKFHTATFDEIEKKLRKNISSKKAKEYFGIKD